MHEPLRHAVAAIFCPVDELWLMLDEHQVHSRIPDLVVGRLNLDVLEQRIDGGWGRPLSQTELRALHSMRPDRGRSLRSVADHMRVGEARAREIMRGLLAEGFAERTQSGSYARRAPIRPLLDVVVSVEAKRSDLIAAFHQARAHATFADRCVVAFDLGYLPRAESMLQTYRVDGRVQLLVTAAQPMDETGRDEDVATVGHLCTQRVAHEPPAVDERVALLQVVQIDLSAAAALEGKV